jgi:hypothetical protein
VARRHAPARISAAHEVAVAALGGEVDRRRRAFLARDVAQIERLAEPGRVSPISTEVALAFKREAVACGAIVDQADAADRGGRQDALPLVSL